MNRPMLVSVVAAMLLSGAYSCVYADTSASSSSSSSAQAPQPDDPTPTNVGSLQAPIKKRIIVTTPAPTHVGGTSSQNASQNNK